MTASSGSRRDNLVPKRLVDRRGRTTTRWVRPERLASTSSGIPSPQDKQEALNALSENLKIVRTILADLKPHEGSVDASSWREQRKKVEAHLDITDKEYLTVVRALAKELHESVPGGATTSRRWALMHQLQLGNKNVVRALYAHRDEYAKAPALVSLHTHLIESLINRGIVSQEADGSIPTLSVHLKAQRHYEQHRMARTAYTLVPSYESNPEYLAMVEKHADHIDQLLRYRKDRGLESAGKRPAALDEDDFAEYLSHGPVAEGSL